MGDLTPDSTLEYWLETGRGQPRDAEAHAWILTRPAIEAAIGLSVQEALAFFNENTAFNLQFFDAGSYVLGLLAIYLHATGGLTHRRLAALCGTSRLISNGRASAILLQLRSRGLVQRAPKRAADRTVRYTPSAAMMTAYRGRLRFEIEAAAMVNPLLAPLAAAWDLPGVSERFIAAVGEEIVDAARNPSPRADALIAPISAARGGLLILYTLIHEAAGGQEVRPSISALAKRFRVSRSHVRRVLRLASEAGLLSFDSGAHAVRLLPPLRDALRDYYAHMYCGAYRAAARFVIDVAAPDAAAGARRETDPSHASASRPL
jgi:DNA-binding GntR family transcriptional regulator